MLHVESGFEQLSLMVGKLPKEGLFLAISNNYIRNDQNSAILLALPLRN